MKEIILFLLIPITLPLSVFANGGDQRVADGYVVNLSRVPFTPVVGVKTVLLASFVDLKKGKLMQDDMLVSIRIAEGRGSRAFIHEKRDMLVKGGVLEYSYIFQNPGMHEIFFDFVLVDDPSKQVHEVPDFLLDVQESVIKKDFDAAFIGISIILGVIIGFLGGRFTRQKRV